MIALTWGVRWSWYHDYSKESGYMIMIYLRLWDTKLLEAQICQNLRPFFFLPQTWDIHPQCLIYFYTLQKSPVVRLS